MAWIELHQTLVNHPKTRRLARRLGVTVPAAVGHLACFWCWCIEYAQDGNLSTYEADELADAAMWDGDAAALVDALVTAGFLDKADDALRIHDWHDYAGRLVEKRAANAQRMRDARAKNVQNTCDARAGATVPNRTVPYLTKDTPAPAGATADAVGLLSRVVGALSVPDDAGRAHEMVVVALEAAGFSCRKEFPVPDRGNGRSGRLDILAHFGDVCFAIEIDQRTPRSKSIAKVRQIEGAVGVIILRGGEARDWPGVDVVLALRLAESAPFESGEPPIREPFADELPEDFVTSTGTRPARKPTTRYTSEFEAWWAEYPPVRRYDKAACFKKFKAVLVGGVTEAEMMTGLARWKASEDWRKDDGKYVCAPEVWLNKRRWEDAPAPVAGLTAVPDLAPSSWMTTPSPALDELLAKPWYSQFSKHIGSPDRVDVALMNWAAELGLRDVSRAKTELERQGLRGAGDWVWSHRMEA